MFKFILIAILVIYGLYRITSFMGNIASAGRQQQSPRQDSSIRVDKEPSKQSKSFDGGEYVDYEEVK